MTVDSFDATLGVMEPRAKHQVRLLLRQSEEHPDKPPFPIGVAYLRAGQGPQVYLYMPHWRTCRLLQGVSSLDHLQPDHIPEDLKRRLGNLEWDKRCRTWDAKDPTIGLDPDAILSTARREWAKKHGGQIAAGVDPVPPPAPEVPRPSPEPLKTRKQRSERPMFQTLKTAASRGFDTIDKDADDLHKRNSGLFDKLREQHGKPGKPPAK